VTTWLVIAAVALGTYGLRASMFVVVGDRRLPAWTQTPMSLVAPAAVAALVTSTVAIRSGQVVAPAVAEVLAVAVGFLAVRRSGNVMHAFVAGLPVLWALTALGR
jgi:branched-subunit amino acid transport protein